LRIPAAGRLGQARLNFWLIGLLLSLAYLPANAADLSAAPPIEVGVKVNY
jgi:hypothetical protein